MDKKNKQASHSFYQSVHFWGRLTVGIALISTLLIPLYLTFVLGYKPQSADIIAGIISIAGFVGVIWVVEPISYFPTLGPAGTYMSFLSGNIGNMRLPVIAATQDALDLEPGSEQAELAGIFAIISSTFTNLLILALVMVAGQAIISRVSPLVLGAFDYALPGILGAMVVMLAGKLRPSRLLGLTVIALVAINLIKQSPAFLPAKLANLIVRADVGLVAICGIIYALVMAKRDRQS